MTDTPRDPGAEWAFTDIWGGVLHHISVKALNEFADQRAGAAPIRDLLTREFDRETLEELADGRNYLCWWAQQVEQLAETPSVGDEIKHEIGLALGAVALAYVHALKAQQLQGEWIGAPE